jgi:hypothetical protein
LTNYVTGETRAVPGIPAGLQALKITADGRHAISASLDSTGPHCKLLAFDTVAGKRTELPATESWTPVAISESRGVVLALMIRPPDTWSGPGWIEIPLKAVFSD